MSPIAKLHVDLTVHTPAYLQIISGIKQAIANGELKPGDQLPTVRQLAADLRINFNTVARAYRLLDEEGVISTQHGRGTFILDAPSGRDLQRLRQQQIRSLSEHYVEEAQKLGFEPDEVRSLIEEHIRSWERNRN
ncbi:MAG: GntR family transcriptional regulator [Anaerolineales bacterium]|nr:GntR family transcriptional regulator [Anaerolineales bacterium]MCW5887479.1 GntR family transcriptional regulator [Anaerolineales bacterium]